MEKKRLQRSTESYGLGQSGYTAGRAVEDPALGVTGRNISYPRGADEHLLDEGDDERFIGSGGRPWVPEQTEQDDDATDVASRDAADVAPPTADPR